MKLNLLLILLPLTLISCAQMQKAQLKYVCTKHAAYNAGTASAALLENKNYNKFNQCPDIELMKSSYDQGYDHYIEHERNKVGLRNGKAGFGANIRFVCVGTLFDQTYIGKGQREAIAKQHLRYNCNASDNSVHCSNMFTRCRLIDFSERL